jgi:DNA-binding GntR family transcriptional regulator
MMNDLRKLRAGPMADLPQFDAVMPMTRRAQVAETMRSFILSGQLAPGTQLVESKLASRFGVSRGSIREAIWELIDQGLLVNRPYAGTFVVSLDERTMAEVFSVRCALERYAFTQVWPRRDTGFRKEFAARHKALARAIKARKQVESIKAETHFHSYPYEFSGNQTLLDVWHQLCHKIQLTFVMSQVIVRDMEFITASERYLAVALGSDLDAMLREIDHHLALGMIAIRKLLSEAPALASGPRKPGPTPGRVAAARGECVDTTTSGGRDL